MGSQFKVVVIGDGSVGKTTFVTRHISAGFEKRYVPTIGADLYTTKFATNHGDLTLNVWDTAGQEKLAGLRDGYYVGADAAIIMFDVSSRVSYKNVPIWHRDIERMCPDIPIVLCGNKVDVGTRAVKAKSVQYHRKKHLQYYDISAIANYNIEKPFLWLARQLVQKEDLVFIGENFRGPEIDLGEARIKQLDKEFEEAQAAPIDDDDEEL